MSDISRYGSLLKGGGGGIGSHGAAGKGGGGKEKGNPGTADPGAAAADVAASAAAGVGWLVPKGNDIDDIVKKGGAELTI